MNERSEKYPRPSWRFYKDVWNEKHDSERKGECHDDDSAALVTPTAISVLAVSAAPASIMMRKTDLFTGGTTAVAAFLS
jgi:hypothetical protein